MVVTFSSHLEARLDLLHSAVAINPESPKLWYDLAYALADSGDYEGFAAAFERAFRLRPSGVFPRAEQLGDAAAAQTLRDRAEALVNRGLTCGAALAALAVSEWALGNERAVDELLDYQRFLRCPPSVIPAGFAPDRFFDELTVEIKKELSFHGAKDNGVMQNTWRANDTLDSDAPVCKALMAEIRRRVATYISEIFEGPSHPLTRSRVDRFRIKSWAILAQNDGHLVSHIHPKAWVNGVYYVASPDGAGVAEAGAGRLRLGPPDNAAVQSNAIWPELFIDPCPGTLVLMPAYFFHRTQPTRSDQERICVAFNVEPAA